MSSVRLAITQLNDVEMEKTVQTKRKADTCLDWNCKQTLSTDSISVSPCVCVRGTCSAPLLHPKPHFLTSHHRSIFRFRFFFVDLPPSSLNESSSCLPPPLRTRLACQELTYFHSGKNCLVFPFPSIRVEWQRKWFAVNPPDITFD